MMEFKQAQRKQAKLRLALASPAGGGKTYSALLIAKGLGGRIALIDTEHGSGSLYADSPGMPAYEVLELSPPFSPQRYIEAIEAAEKAGFGVLIIDSLSHAWAAEGGVLDMQEAARLSSKSGNSWTAWREVTPKHNQLVEAMLQSPLHIIATMRSRQTYAQEEVEGEGGKKKAVIKKLGLAPVQREGMDYEFTVVLDLSQEHYATSSKDRTGLFDGQHFKPSEETGKKIGEWLNRGGNGKAKPTPMPAGVTEAIALAGSPISPPTASDSTDEDFDVLGLGTIMPIETAIQKQARIDEVSRALTAEGWLPPLRSSLLSGAWWPKNKFPPISFLAELSLDQLGRLLRAAQEHRLPKPPTY